MNTKGNRITTGLLTAALLALTPLMSQAQDRKITLNYSETAGPAEAQVAFAKQFSEYADELSDGTIRIVVHPGGTLARLQP